jgi:hypothetical protein
MANSSTLKDVVPSLNPKYNAISEYQIVIDTVDTDLTIATPATAARLWVAGILFSQETPATVSFISGADEKEYPIGLAANQGFDGLTDKGFYFVTNPSEPLKIKSSAAITSLILRIIEAAQ